MQPTDEDPLELTHLGTDPESGEDGSPRAFATNRTSRNTVVLQGWRVTDPAALAELHRLGMPEHETAVEVPVEVLRFLPGFRSDQP